jgi:flavin reductase (DIM6/NTAB) family NADH-FMN oxidoreductase RutF
MNDLPKQSAAPDPANEFASDSSPIDPRDFRNALGAYGTGVTIITATAADGSRMASPATRLRRSP